MAADLMADKIPENPAPMTLTVMRLVFSIGTSFMVNVSLFSTMMTTVRMDSWSTRNAFDTMKKCL